MTINADMRVSVTDRFAKVADTAGQERKFMVELSRGADPASGFSWAPIRLSLNSKPFTGSDPLEGLALFWSGMKNELRPFFVSHRLSPLSLI